MREAGVFGIGDDRRFGFPAVCAIRQEKSRENLPSPAPVRLRRFIAPLSVPKRRFELRARRSTASTAAVIGVRRSRRKSPYNLMGNGPRLRMIFGTLTPALELAAKKDNSTGEVQGKPRDPNATELPHVVADCAEQINPPLINRYLDHPECRP
jgi:hypothetical protein